ncbi:ABC transporter permease subunit [Proteinivorax tanatarense]|uniref:ABC transporter permease subunit n=1 Tax=Proteinivorax tanatarense TaxID=1260629 RepID=A0AAU7VKT6_9FIRM
MGLLKFELKKVFKQKLLWLLGITILITAGVYYQFGSQQGNIMQDQDDRIESYFGDVTDIQETLSTMKENSDLDDKQAKQYERSRDMVNILIRWQNLGAHRYNNALEFERNFLELLQQYEQQGGEPIPSIMGVEKEKVIEKNAWLIENELYYENEINPQSIHLLAKENALFLLGVLGIFILLLFFGSTITEEKEENTWQTLKTQPIAEWKLMGVKYISLILVTVLFVIMILVAATAIPYMFVEEQWGYPIMNFQYPQVLEQQDDFAIISTFEYLMRASILFLGAAMFVFSISILVNRWGKNSFTVIMMTGLITVIGYFVTDIFSVMQSVFNPFYHLQFAEILSKVPQNTDWLYPFVATAWSLIILGVAAFVPERELSLLHYSYIKKPYRRGDTKKGLSFWKINVFEWRKLKRKGLLLKAFAMLACLVIFGHYIISHQTQQKEEEYIGQLKDTYFLESQLSTWEEFVESTTARLKEQPENEGLKSNKEAYKKAFNHIKKRLEKKESAVKGYKQGQWEPFYEYQIFWVRMWNQEFDTGSIDYDGRSFGQLLLIASIEEKKWLMEKDIQPVLAGELIPTTMFSRANEEWVERNTKIDNSGLFSLYLYFERYIYFVPLAIFLFLLGGGLASERNKKNTLNLLKTQPIAENKLFLGKLFNAKIVAVASCIAIFLVVVLVGTVFERFGDWQYPILNYDSIAEVEASDYDGHKVDIEDFTVGFHFMNLGRFLIESIVLFSFVAMFFITLSIFISLFLKREMSVLATTALIGAAGFALSQGLTEMAHLSPFTYLNIPKIINGEIATTLNNPSVNLQTGIVILLAVTAGLVLAGYFISGRKNAVTNKNQATEELNSRL